MLMSQAQIFGFNIEFRSLSNSLPTICEAILVMIGRTMSLSVSNKAQIDNHLVQEYCQRYPKNLTLICHI
jgi:hypothetical protein